MSTEKDWQCALAEMSEQRQAVEREWEGRSLRDCLRAELSVILAKRRATELKALDNMISFDIGVGR